MQQNVVWESCQSNHCDTRSADQLPNSAASCVYANPGELFVSTRRLYGDTSLLTSNTDLATRDYCGFPVHVTAVTRVLQKVHPGLGLQKPLVSRAYNCSDVDEGQNRAEKHTLLNPPVLV